MSRPRVPLRKRLTGHLHKPVAKLSPHECWFWTGSIVKFVPTVVLDGRRRSARRVIYEEFVRPLHELERVRPACKELACVNPNHSEVYGRVVELDPKPLPDIEVEIPDDDGMSIEELYDTIVGMKSRDPDEIADMLGVTPEQAAQALERFALPT